MHCVSNSFYNKVIKTKLLKDLRDFTGIPMYTILPWSNNDGKSGGGLLGLCSLYETDLSTCFTPEKQVTSNPPRPKLKEKKNHKFNRKINFKRIETFVFQLKHMQTKTL